MGVAVYVRIAVDKLFAGTSGIDEQLQAMQVFCDRLGWHLVVEYAEGRYRGLTRHQPLFEALVTAVARNSFHAVVVEKTDRLSRSPAELETLRINLERRGVSIIETPSDIAPDS